EWAPGKTSDVYITLVTADYGLLSCASTQSFDGRHCSFKAENEPWPREAGAPLDDNKANVIQPYRTWNDNQLLLVAGLWSHPELASRLHREPSANIPSEKLARFVTQC